MSITNFESNPLMIPISARNQLVDDFFYDISSLTAEEWLSLSARPWIDQQGGILVVSPSADKEAIKHYPSPLEFILTQGREVGALAIAGVGSSAVGTAALARNIADVYNIKVAGLVSGYGMADVATEGLGGWFFFGKIDQLRYGMKSAAELISQGLAGFFAPGREPARAGGMDFLLDDFVAPSQDVGHLNELLFERYLGRRLPIRLLVGHSKGSLLLSSVLNHLDHELSKLRDQSDGLKEKDYALHGLKIVTLGAVVDLPKELISPENQYQFLGDFDLLGRANSRSFAGNLDSATRRVPMAGHHLNTRIPFGIKVKDLLREHLPALPEIEPENHRQRAVRRAGLVGRIPANKDLSRWSKPSLAEASEAAPGVGKAPTEGASIKAGNGSKIRRQSKLRNRQPVGGH